MRPPRFKSSVLVSVLSGVVAIALLAAWLASGPRRPQLERVPGTDKAPGSESGSGGNAVLAGKLVVSQKVPTGSSGAWPGFRGKDRDGISPDSKHLAHSWDNSGLRRQIWSIDVGDGYAGAAVLNGRVYLMDYDRERKQDALGTAVAAVIWALYAFLIGRLGGKVFEDKPWVGLLMALGIVTAISGIVELIRRIRARRRPGAEDA